MDIEKVIKKIEKEIEEKKIAALKMEGYIVGLVKALAILDQMREEK